MIANECRKRAAAVEPLGPGLRQLPCELADEDRHVPELAEAPEPRQRGDRVVPGALLDDPERELPAGCGDLLRELRERRRLCLARAHRLSE